MKARLVLNAALALMTLAMAIVALAAIWPGVFFTGVYLLDVAFVALAVAGFMYLLSGPETA